MSTTLLGNETKGSKQGISNIEQFILEKGKPFPKLNIKGFAKEVASVLKEKGPISDEQVRNEIILRGLSNIDESEPDWTFFCAHVQLDGYYKEAAKNRGYDEKEKYGSLLTLIQTLTEKGIYNPVLLERYTEAQIQELEKEIQSERDKLFTYIGLLTLADRYLATDHDKNVYELPQERFMIIAMTLMMNETKKKRVALVKEAYWALSNLYMTVATPTLANAGKTYGQLSSCFIDVIEDSLDGIYGNNHDVARLSKNGGGIGVYLGKIRSRGASIKGFKGISAGVIAWMKQLNTTAVNVDQLGQRQGAIAAYLDVWHKDIFTFLEARLNNGDERVRTHDLFTGVCIPDLFMEVVENRGEWHLFDPHETQQVMGYSLEDFYDENEEIDENGNRIVSGTFREKYFECVNNPILSRTTVPAIEIMKSIMISQLETGTPYMFYRDEVNRQNPNKHEGIIYCSNLCTEIAQNGSTTSIVEEKTKDGLILVTKQPGDFVVCNLSSINLARAIPANVIERLVPIQVRMLDNVIDLNDIPVLQAKLTNEKYRAVGLGTFGMHHLFAKKGIYWESQEAVDYVQEVYENVAYHAIKASMELSKEKGHYPLFTGSEWQDGTYFDNKGYENLENAQHDWKGLKQDVAVYGMRNGYVMCVAPNSSTSIIAGSTASIDPIFNVKYSEEKKNYKIPVTAPEIDHNTFEFYKKTAYMVDQHWSIKQNAMRQRFIDQAISFNIYVRNDITARDLLDIHLDAWKSKLKTTYYVRSKSGQEIEDCDSCHS
ncbi:ribonucleoside-diphosphate reductase subunit alpha [Priestia filamentosa]|uniref:ribonucleoside-diphosphate reductase subunit alpha n=1 Tax=Priestia filamentosa TaxID=1402861 RepID=UPI00397A9D54